MALCQPRRHTPSHALIPARGNQPPSSPNAQLGPKPPKQPHCKVAIMAAAKVCILNHVNSGGRKGPAVRPYEGHLLWVYGCTLARRCPPPDALSLVPHISGI